MSVLPDAADEPPKRLVGFDKVELRPGEKKRVEITIDPSASSHPLSVWDATADAWVTPTGDFEFFVGNSSHAGDSDSGHGANARAQQPLTCERLGVDGRPGNQQSVSWWPPR